MAKKEGLQYLVYYILERYFKEYGEEELNTKAYLIMNYISGESDLIINSLTTDGIVDRNATVDLVNYKQDIQDKVTLDYVFDKVAELKEKPYTVKGY